MSPPPDLSAYLAPPPASDWIENGPSPTVIDGAFTADEYAHYVSTVDATPNQVAAHLESLGFTGGFGREWEQRVTLNYLVERVFAFADAQGATSWYDGIKTEAETGKSYVRDIPSASQVPDSFGVVLRFGDGVTQWRVDFHEGNFVYVVHADALTDDMTPVAVGQAMAEYRTGSRGQIASGKITAAAPSWLVPFAVVGAATVFLVVVAVVVVIAVVVRRRQPAAAAFATGVRMSPDGAYWWDGTTWRDAGVYVPPMAQRSPDGAYWWDGRTWRPVP